ncbi:MAG: hypothetical protein HY554_09730 [Elusimicrobia bacterium]|nr:hypothetical protein [Elusimicrobiota bacterium]
MVRREAATRILFADGYAERAGDELLLIIANPDDRFSIGHCPVTPQEIEVR